MRNMKQLLLGLTLMASSQSLLAQQLQRPNVLILFADDLGWADLGCYGSTFYETPVLDSLAANGIRFTQGYSTSPVCSPARASLLTASCLGVKSSGALK